MAGPMEIVGVGIATIDIIQAVDAFPEDTSAFFAKDTAVAAQLGCACHWLGTMTDPARDGDAAFVSDNLQSFGIDARAATILPSGAMPVSYILASNATGSRTIIHHRDLPELSFESFCDSYNKLVRAPGRKHDDDQPRGRYWFHFEGRNLGNVEEMIQFLRNRNESVTISLEIEALRNDWSHLQRLLRLADVAFVSKDYIRKKLGLRDAAAFFEHLHTLWKADWIPRTIMCPWGSDGVYYLDVKVQKKHHLQAAPLGHTVDSVGAGDSFIGAALAAFAHDLALHDAVRVACQVATAKCAQQGFRLPSKLRDDVVTSLLATGTL